MPADQRPAKRKLRRLIDLRIITVLLSILFPTVLDGFWIPVHRRITLDAFTYFSLTELPETERKGILKGISDADYERGDLIGGGAYKISHYWKTLDSGTRAFGRYDQRYHFDNDRSFPQVLQNYLWLARRIDLSKDRKDAYLFGIYLHTIEDFYSHSNFVTLYAEYRSPFLKGWLLQSDILHPTLEEVLDKPEYAGFLDVLRLKLCTGYYPSGSPADKPYSPKHGRPVGPGMNKDTINRNDFDDARESARRAAEWYLKLYTNDPTALERWSELKRIVWKELVKPEMPVSGDLPPCPI